MNLTKSNGIWSELRHLGLVDSSSCVEPNFSHELLNTFFSSVQCSDDEVETPLLYGPPLPYNFSFPRITIDDLIWSLRQFTSKSVGFDKISLRVQKLCYSSIGSIIVGLFNKILLTNTYPLNWKRAILIPIKKIPNPDALEHFRPISLLCVISKIFEKILADKIMTYLKSKVILDPFQSGFQKGFGTLSVLTKLIGDIREASEDKLITMLVLFDFSKAFDRVSPKILLPNSNCMVSRRMLVH